MTAASLRAVEAPEGLLDLRPLVPAGRYKLRFRHHETALMFRHAPKLALWFSICEPGEVNGPHVGALVARWYNVKALVGKPGRGGRFCAVANGDLALEYVTLFRPLGRLDRISLDPFRENIVEGEIRNVTENRSQIQLPEQCQYSVVKKLVGVWKP